MTKITTIRRHQEVRWGQGSGYRTSTGRICMLRCFKCGRENHAMAVASGQCAWCGYNPNQEDEGPGAA